VATVEAGINIEELLAVLDNQYGLSLNNIPCVTGMQIGGLIQTGSHGTGIAVQPVNESVIGLKMVDANGNEIEMSEANGDRFHEAKCSLGTIGVVVEVKLESVPFYYLKEDLRVMDMEDVRYRMC
jgi:L-galactono-1,4-lactone dehydrogenase